ncbi:nsp1-like carboxy-terminal region [Cystoisospora suis]|uniref:Nsp1-like carboxy-terminal region n=1 Tax=Cystoisospora suis TaxID=483139 RepID=A0A2C6KRY6_9APIC|nr:nsp1-like carboxy-terminal region [Cystoisospora suis]
MIEQSKKIHSLQEEQVKIERRQVYIADIVEGLEKQQQDLFHLLASVEQSLLKEVQGGGGDYLHNENRSHADYGQGGKASSSSSLHLPGGEEGEVRLDGGGRWGGRYQDSSFDSSSSSSSSEELLSQRLKNIDDQLNEVHLSLCDTAERYYPGPLAVLAQVLGVHQAALQSAWKEANDVEQRIDSIKQNLGGGGGGGFHRND